MGCGPSVAASWRQPDSLHGLTECPVHVFWEKRLSPQRHKYMVIEGGVGATSLEVPFEPGACRFVQGYKSAFAKLGIPDDKTIGRDVGIAQVDRFRSSQSSAGKQREQRAIGCSAERFMSQPGSSFDELSDLFAGQNVGGWAGRSLGTKDRWWHLVAWVFGAQITRNRMMIPSRSARCEANRVKPAHSMAMSEET